MGNEFAFYAMLSRLKLIERWSLMRGTETENVQEHSMQVAVIAHALALFRRKFYRIGEALCPSPEYVAVLAMFHDASEVLTGDLPTPVKYYNEEIKKAYKQVESSAIDRLLEMIPLEFRADYNELLRPDTDDKETAEAMRLVKAADKLSAYIKCLEEERAGNKEFHQARNALELELDKLKLPEVTYFCKKFLPAFSKSIDQLQAM